MKNITDSVASKFLGQKTKMNEKYTPSLLVRVPRFENRMQYGINNKALPFKGWDVWHAYEFSSMTENGLPVTRLLKLKYSCENEYLIESKSLKLYLNSFNMSRFGKTQEECLEICKKIIEKDLSDKLETKVFAHFIPNSILPVQIYSNFRNLTEFIDENTLKIEKFKEAPELLEIEKKEHKEEYFLKFDSLRSNCRVTHQPDFGDAFIYYKSKNRIKEISLVKYLCSFRSEYHFHEECCEMIFKRIFDILEKDDELCVSILYTRRGGIDISPSRWNKNCPADVLTLIDIEKFARNGVKQ